MPHPPPLPDGLVKTGQSKTFDQDTTPAGLQEEHSTRDDTWGRLNVVSGTLEFVRSADPDHPTKVVAGETLVIEPGDPHHVRLTGPVEFFIEFFRHADP